MFVGIKVLWEKLIVISGEIFICVGVESFLNDILLVIIWFLMKCIYCILCFWNLNSLVFFGDWYLLISFGVGFGI